MEAIREVFRSRKFCYIRYVICESRAECTHRFEVESGCSSRVTSTSRKGREQIPSRWQTNLPLPTLVRIQRRLCCREKRKSLLLPLKTRSLPTHLPRPSLQDSLPTRRRPSPLPTPTPASPTHHPVQRMALLLPARGTQLASRLYQCRPR